MSDAKAWAEVINNTDKDIFSKEEVVGLLNEIADVQEVSIQLSKKKEEFFNNDIRRIVKQLRSLDTQFNQLSAANDLLREKTKKTQHNGDKKAATYILKVVNDAKENDKRISEDICELLKMLLGNCYKCPFYEYGECVHGGFSVKPISTS